MTPHSLPIVLALSPIGKVTSYLHCAYISISNSAPHTCIFNLREGTPSQNGDDVILRGGTPLFSPSHFLGSGAGTVMEAHSRTVQLMPLILGQRKHTRTSSKWKEPVRSWWARSLGKWPHDVGYGFRSSPLSCAWVALVLLSQGFGDLADRWHPCLRLAPELCTRDRSK